LSFNSAKRRSKSVAANNWYDSQPHPSDPSLAATDPHHKHVPPDIKNHRLPAPELSFTRPNLPFLIQEIEQMLDRTLG
jgi:hypothetical protein